jgi:hypothetical protein
MASGHVNRTKRPNTWLHRPDLRREDSPCQPGAVHTWPEAAENDVRSNIGYWGLSGLVVLTVSFVGPDPGCVKTHKSAEGRKYNSPTRYLAESAQHD